MTLDPRSFYNDCMPGKFGADYEAARWHATPLKEAQYAMMFDVLHREVFPKIQTARNLLEIGPGAGTWSKLLIGAAPHVQYTLLDISSEMLGRAKQALAEYREVTYIEHDFLSYEPSERFDTLFSSRALEYMPDKREFAQQAHRLLRPGGRGFFITKIPKPFLDRLARRHLSDFHRGQIAPQKLAGLFTQAGLVVERIGMATASVPLAHSPRLNRFCHRLFRAFPLVFPLSWLAESYLVVVHKPS